MLTVLSRRQLFICGQLVVIFEHIRPIAIKNMRLFT